MKRNLTPTFWKKYGFEILLVLSMLFLMGMALYRLGEKGTWSTSYYIPPTVTVQKKRIPKDSAGERECRRVLENYFKKPFGKIRPDFLKNPAMDDGRNLELDCYNDDLKIAVEYNGVQHYKYNPHFHKSRDAFQNQRYRDYIKRNICKENGITLIEVPYTIQIKDIELFLYDKLRKEKKIDY
jgi:hypothetical protein